MPVFLEQAEHELSFGGKAVQLGRARRAGLPVPDGRALSVELVEALADGHHEARARVRRAFEGLDATRVAVRSSAVGEDGQSASFAGQYLTRLNIICAETMAEAVLAVRESGRTESVLAYRRRMGLVGPPRVAVVVQAMIDAECAGVMFTRNPMTGADERVIEAAWGLGESVVSGIVDPDRYRMKRGGEVIERFTGEKDVAVRALPTGETAELPVEPMRVNAPCLDDARLAALEELATRCDGYFDGEHDIEFAFVGPELYLLQRRGITR